MAFLPFTRPQIDEETIAGVAEVLRSGWITCGPEVIQPERSTSATPAMVSSSICGRVNGKKAIAR